MWRCPKCQTEVEDSFDICWSCGTTINGVEDPSFVTADEADPIPDKRKANKNSMNHAGGSRMTRRVNRAKLKD